MNTGSRPDLTVSPISSLVTEDAAEDPRRIRISRMALVLVGVLRLATQPLMGRILPGAVDPPAERLALCGLCVLFLALTAAARYRRHVVVRPASFGGSRFPHRELARMGCRVRGSGPCKSSMRIPQVRQHRCR